MARAAGDPVAYGYGGHAFAEGAHHAREFPAGGKGEGGLHLIFALDHEAVGEINAHMAHGHPHFPGPRGRLGEILQHKAFWGPFLFA